MFKMAGILLFLLPCQYLTAQPSFYKDSLQKAYLSEKNDSIKTWKHIFSKVKITVAFPKGKVCQGFADKNVKAVLFPYLC